MMRPRPTIRTSATTACRSSKAKDDSVTSGLPVSSTAMANRIGATRRSWNKRAEKPARPAAVFRRFCSARTGITMAVDDKARARPTTVAAVIVSTVLNA